MLAGACRCSAGFTGPNCGTLTLAPAPAPASRGAASPYAWPLPGVNASSWGLSSVFDEGDGLFHGLAEIACGTMGIMDSSTTFIAHMTSPTGAGAWTPSPAQPVFAGTATFNPAIVRAADGTFVVAFRYGGIVPGGVYCASTAPVNTVLGVAVFTENSTLWESGLARWRARVPVAFYYEPADGPTPRPPVCGTDSRFNGQKVFNASTSGVVGWSRPPIVRGVKLAS